VDVLDFQISNRLAYPDIGKLFLLLSLLSNLARSRRPPKLIATVQMSEGRAKKEIMHRSKLS